MNSVAEVVETHLGATESTSRNALACPTLERPYNALTLQTDEPGRALANAPQAIGRLVAGHTFDSV